MKINKLLYDQDFVKNVRKLPNQIKKLLVVKQEWFVHDPHDSRLKTHKLKGRLSGLQAFSINHSYRVIFDVIKSDTVIFLDVGTHEVYK